MNTATYEVHLDMFEGPLDLLLYLIRKNDLNVYDIPISEITQEYLSYLDLMKDLNLELAGEFLVMASTLMQIKARMLLPSHEGDEAEGPDPREELVAKLLEYQRFKEAAKFLEKRAEEFKDVFYRGSPHFSDDEKTLSLNMFDLLSTLQEILDNAEDRGMVIQGDQFPVEEKIRKIEELLEKRSWITFRDIFQGEARKLAILSCFLALLELIKLQKVFARQEALFAEILIYKKEAPPPEPIWPGAAGKGYNLSRGAGRISPPGAETAPATEPAAIAAAKPIATQSSAGTPAAVSEAPAAGPAEMEKAAAEPPTEEPQAPQEN